ncbi:TetR/AcrR family transcriptional regulator [Corynebacterium sp. TAE3-ERU30]|uniref:TetR/AcrR family transcriptional regulator n=1 Tax=Corynebacterium sp. TAE3-ERU30 TaxID=2849496 RepID=UPI001C49319C|nr:TetR/AcrR family transcriptional regulator [Corynebacterium sp. TAE3-ERU30]MBV7282130.1 TetR/AcrR family transcriptional regulator [Corynebacterium sp. TAE3-ERU30]
MTTTTPVAAPLTPRQQELFATLRKDFLAHGFADFTIDQAVRTLHCSKSTIYAVGRTRDEIIRRVLVSFFRDVAEHTTAAIRDAGSRRQALERYFNAMSEALQPASQEFMHDMCTLPVATEVYITNTRAATAQIQRIITDGMQAGEFREVPASFLAALIDATMTHIQAGEYAHTLPIQDTYQVLGGIILHGIDAS